MKKWIVALICSLGFGVAHADLYYTGFEVSEGWATGSLGTNPEQQPSGGSWGNTGVAQITTGNPRTGDYSVYFNSENIGNHTASFIPDSPFSGYTTLTLSYYVYLPSYPNADGNSQISNDNNHRLQLVTDATTLQLQFDNFDTAGNPGRYRAYVSGGLGGGGENGLMNQAWRPDEWTFVSVTLDFANNTYSYLINSPSQGESSISDQVIGHDITQLNGANLIHRDVGEALDLTMYVDDFSVIPEPSTMGLLGLALMIFYARSRRQRV
jgi:hypothetical protein